MKETHVNNPAATAIRQLAELQSLDRIRREKLKTMEELEAEIAQLEQEIRERKETMEGAAAELTDAVA
jgi:septal ring factor EnvC (AmiA/AmiB activator)